MKRKVAGWILFGAGIFYGIWASLGVVFFSALEYGSFADIAATAIPASFAIGGGWKLDHPRPKP